MITRIVAVLGTVAALGFGGWLMLHTEPANAANPGWLTDMQKAQEVAAKEKKDLLINFTGSDWCGWCIKLREEVFTKKGFGEAQDNFVLVEMDFPSDESILPPKTREQNEAWSQKFGVNSFPTIVLADAKGRPYGSLGYVAGGPPAFLTQLKITRKAREARDESLAKAQHAKGVDKAKLLASALDEVPAEFYLPMYRTEIQEIISLDEQNQAGLQSRYTRVLQEADAQKRVNELQQEVQVAYEKDGADAALKIVREALAEKESQANPVLRASLVKGEVQLLITFEKLEQAQARLEELIKDKSFSKEDQLAFRERQAKLFKETGQTDAALKALDSLIADAGAESETALALLTEKAEILSEADRPKEALEIYNAILKKTKRGTNEWLTAQLNRGELFKQTDQPQEAGRAFDEMLTVAELSPIQQAMLLIYAAESYHAAKQADTKTARIEKADGILKKLGDSEEIPPQALEELSGRIKQIRNEDKPAATKKPKAKSEESPK